MTTTLSGEAVAILVRRGQGGQDAEMSAPSRSVLYELLYSAIIEIRGASGGEMSRADSDFVFHTSYLIHNWPHRLRDATSDADHDALLREFWQNRHKPSDPWMKERLAFLGVDTDALS